MIVSQAADVPSTEDLTELLHRLQFYLKHNQPPEEILTPAQLKARMQ